MKKVIRELEVKKNIALKYAKEGDTYHAGAYKAYHSAIKLIKRVERDKNKVVI